MAAGENKRAISDSQVYDLIESAREGYSGAPFKPLDSSRFPEMRRELQRGNIYPVVDDDPRIKRLLSALK